MTSTPHFLPLLAFVALAGCLDGSRPSAPPPPAVGGFNPAGTAACDAPALGREYVGRDASVLADVLFDSPVRIVRPGDPVTTNLIPNRVNFELDDRGVVARVTCG